MASITCLQVFVEDPSLPGRYKLVKTMPNRPQGEMGQKGLVSARVLTKRWQVGGWGEVERGWGVGVGPLGLFGLVLFITMVLALSIGSSPSPPLQLDFRT